MDKQLKFKELRENAVRKHPNMIRIEEIDGAKEEEEWAKGFLDEQAEKLNELSKHKVNNFIKDYQVIANRIETIIEKMALMKHSKTEGDLIGFEFYNNQVIAKYESQAYMNYEITYHEFPIHYLYEVNWVDHFAEKLKEEEEIKFRLKEQSKLNKEFFERKEYERLKMKFEGKEEE